MMESPTLMAGLIILIIGTVFVVFPGKKDYVTRLINLEIPAFGLLLITLAYNETIALLTFITVSTLATFIFVLIIERTEDTG